MSYIPSPATDDDESIILSATPTPSGHLHRTISSQWSAADTPIHHNQGTSYFPAPPSPTITRTNPTPILRNSSTHSARRAPARSASASSSQGAHRNYRDEGVLSEADEEGGNNEDEDDEDHEVEDQQGSRSKRLGKAPAADTDGDGDNNGDEEEDLVAGEDDPITLKERQSLINVQHPFGLPIWKPALYKKSRSVTRYADEALHSVPSAQAERHLLPGNIFWVLAFGWWLAAACIAVSAILFIIPRGGRRYASLVFGLGWYLAWPFGKYVEGDPDYFEDINNDDEDTPPSRRNSGSDGNNTVRAGSPDESPIVSRVPLSQYPTITPSTFQHPQNVSWDSDLQTREDIMLLNPQPGIRVPTKSYGATSLTTSPSTTLPGISDKHSISSDFLGKICFWLALICIIAPLMLLVCIICWALVVTIPMAKLNWALIQHMFEQPTNLRFCAAPPVVVVATSQPEPTAPSGDDGEHTPQASRFSVKHPRLAEGQAAPSGSPTSTVLLCTYRAVGLQYYKYTVGGVNILFVNLIPVIFFVIFDGFVLLPMVEHMNHQGKYVPAFLAFIASQGFIFLLSLLSVIPLSYFIGMAVASISAQSSIGMGAVINATFGSIIEIILYSLALTQGKGHLVEGSIVGSLLAGVLLMPGMSMCSGALRRKEQKFNAKSAGVTSMMLIMAIIGALTPTLFYQTYGNFQLICSGCPSLPSPDLPGRNPWICDHCSYKHPDPMDDPFYQSTVKSLMYFCATVLLFSYLIGLWFSLRTHASQIWQNPQPLLHAMDLPTHNRLSIYQKGTPGHSAQRMSSLQRKPSTNIGSNAPSRTQTPAPRDVPRSAASPAFQRRVSYATNTLQASFNPVLDNVDHAVRTTGLNLPTNMTTDDFTRAVAVATVSALRHQQSQAHSYSPGRLRGSAADDGGHGGHDAPSWSRSTSASVLLACTALYALIAELLVEVVDVILEDSGIDEKFLGVTLFALVPNTTEFMNAISFALNGNIALSMEIGSAYALQVCLLQIPAMVAFSAWYNPGKMGEVAKTFTLIFPRWDVVVIILSMFLMTYTYIEAKSNYHRGSILILSYLVLASGFYFAPPNEFDTNLTPYNTNTHQLQEFPAITLMQTLWWYLPCFR